MEMIWKGASPSNPSSWLFTGALFNGYGPPEGFCFDVYCQDEPIKDDKRLTDYNADRRAAEFAAAVRRWSNAYSSDQVLVPMGSDFNYVNANSWFKNIDKLIKYVNANTSSHNVKLVYSTPSCYTKAVNDRGLSYAGKSDDFFPYASDPHAYWTGYFTSRPSLKGMIRRANNILQACKQMDALTDRDWLQEGDVDVLRKAVGVLQHHDAITGTAKQAVTDDYAWRLNRGLDECEVVMDRALRILMARDGKAKPPSQHFCRMSNVTECAPVQDFSHGQNFTVTVYNPLARPAVKYVRVPLVQAWFEANGKLPRVMDPETGRRIPAQLVPIPDAVKRIPGRKGQADVEIVFRADVPPVGAATFFIFWTYRRDGDADDDIVQSRIMSARKAVLSNGRFGLATDERGRPFKLYSDGLSYDFKQSFGYYEAHDGDNRQFSRRASGAYIFRPQAQRPRMFSPSRRAKVVAGPVVQELHQEISPFVSQVVRLYAGQGDEGAGAEFEWLVGPIPVADDVGKEVISRYSTNLPSGSRFWTDSNGRQWLERVRNYRPTWDLNVTEPVSANYYPTTTGAWLAALPPGDGTVMAVLTDRSQGATSLNDGELEFMLHRRLLHDDAFGVGEALDETAFGQGLVVRGSHWLQVTPEGRTAARRARFGAQQRYSDAVISFSPAESSWENYRQKHVNCPH